MFPLLNSGAVQHILLREELDHLRAELKEWLWQLESGGEVDFLAPEDKPYSRIP